MFVRIFRLGSKLRGSTALLILVAAASAAGLPRGADAATVPRPADAATSRQNLQTAVLAGGCFWGMEDVFEKLRGVTNVEAGYSGGAAATAHYETVSTGTTGHAESVRITYDPQRIAYRDLLEVFFTVAHDPTELDRQGPDAGTQYRSAIFYADPQQRAAAQAEVAALSAHKVVAGPIVTQIVPLRAFYPAEAYHQHFADRHPDDPYIVTVDQPKVALLRSKLPQFLKRTAQVTLSRPPSPRN